MRIAMRSWGCFARDALTVKLDVCVYPSPLGFGLEMGNLAPGISDSWQRWLMLRFPVECKILSPVVTTVRNSVSLKSIWCDSGYGLVALSPGPCCCAPRTSLDSRKSCDLILKPNWWNAYLLDLQIARVFRLPSVLNLIRFNWFFYIGAFWASQSA